ncbi:tRNA pseudouridine synthase A [Spiroplasma kunkelii CR2-3x]|uniref:tRNA pseudouridine synthase A n=2 Tax=Spiroplasma kunkelii TaxID=47834 RepID=TRUA_SPIKU|nr:tRNA pseudouridine synthase A [Spiroplasma kunkelii]P60353.1 RecName: Full=tRNA pseudouridine synthase A; AltName: Full=tRNA pseudouridine(38-40) synthase; AltName: Full=tRNA pseudouridylate synthase I; AltName: Full=tRNA-uridine isomerase I [Spiroplasma kunkelii]AAP58883.1 tRNA pseudouridine synthase [Spiroplasma kunkelii CR2-3x]ALA97151.1 tRNA pseudouridine synthase A [Spiroplasma kunkelii CR2-3x]
MLYLLLSIEYDGYDYSGWVKQKNARTIQGELEKAFFGICHQKIWTLGASKTDAGVHACDQKVLVKLTFQPRHLAFFIKTVSQTLPPNINIKGYQFVAENFSVRTVKVKEYVYTINDQEYDLFNHRYELKVNAPLNVKKLHQISQIFVGTHDFAYFAGVKPTEDIATVHTINKIWVKRNKAKKIEIHFRGKIFIRYQIRMLTQNILACYAGKVSLTELQAQLNCPPKGTTTKYCAKPYGLCLKKIKYLYTVKLNYKKLIIL